MTYLRDRSKQLGATKSFPGRPKNLMRFNACIETRQPPGRAPARLTNNLEAEYACCDP